MPLGTSFFEDGRTGITATSHLVPFPGYEAERSTDGGYTWAKTPDQDGANVVRASQFTLYAGERNRQAPCDAAGRSFQLGSLWPDCSGDLGRVHHPVLERHGRALLRGGGRARGRRDRAHDRGRRGQLRDPRPDELGELQRLRRVDGRRRALAGLQRRQHHGEGLRRVAPCHPPRPSCPSTSPLSSSQPGFISIDGTFLTSTWYVMANEYVPGATAPALTAAGRRRAPTHKLRWVAASAAAAAASPARPLPRHLERVEARELQAAAYKTQVSGGVAPCPGQRCGAQHPLLPPHCRFSSRRTVARRGHPSGRTRRRRVWALTAS